MVEPTSGAHGLVFVSFSFVLSAWNSWSKHPDLRDTCAFSWSMEGSRMGFGLAFSGARARGPAGAEQLPLGPAEQI